MAHNKAEARALLHIYGVVVTAAVVVAGFYCVLSLPPTPSQLGTLARIKTIADYYHADSKPAAPGRTVVVLGDSMALAGFDATAFEQAFAGRVEAYNLGLSGKSLYGLLFDLAEPRLVGAHVFLFLSPGLFDSRALDIQQRKLECYKLLGYNLEPAMLRDLSQQLPAEKATLATAPASHFRWRTNWRILESLRWAIRANSASQAERLLTENWLGPYATDLKRASWQGASTPEHIVEQLASLREHEPALFNGHIDETAQQRICLAYIINRLNERCASLTIIIPPLHPLLGDALNPTLEQQYSLVQPLLADTLPELLNYSDSLEATAFRDLMHIDSGIAAGYSATIKPRALAGAGVE